MIGQADARNMPLADGSVHCCITSPPYWGLRDYGLAKWEGGDAECDHKVGRFEYPVNEKQRSNNGSAGHQAHDACPKCGAVRSDSGIGLEKTPDEYVANIVAVFREVWRVLRDDGTLWLNLGDCYNGSGGAGGDYNKGGLKEGQPKFPGRHIGTLKPKDLVGIPWRVAFALRADGWYLRSDIIWHKPNPMPESVTDRPTKSHEYLFLLSKQPRYYYDAQAIVEETTSDAGNRREFRGAGSYTGGNSFVNDASKPNGVRGNDGVPRATRNRRDVWTIPTSPFKGAHFATFPPKLVEPCVLAGTSAKGVCPECGAPRERVVEKSGGTIGKGWHNHEDDLGRGMRGGDDGHNEAAAAYASYRVQTTGWRPTCECHGRLVARKTWVDFGDGRRYTTLVQFVPGGIVPDPVPAVVLDPFCGSGTVGAVCRENGRRFVGLDLSWKYLRDLAYERAESGQLAL